MIKLKDSKMAPLEDNLMRLLKSLEGSYTEKDFYSAQPLLRAAAVLKESNKTEDCFETALDYTSKHADKLSRNQKENICFIPQFNFYEDLQKAQQIQDIFSSIFPPDIPLLQMQILNESAGSKYKNLIAGFLENIFNSKNSMSKLVSFAPYAGEIVLMSAYMWKWTGEEKWKDSALKFAAKHPAFRNPDTGLIPNCPRDDYHTFRDTFIFHCIDTSVTGIWCSRLLQAYKIMNTPELFRNVIKTLLSWNRFAWDFKSGCPRGLLTIDGAPVKEQRTPPDSTFFHFFHRAPGGRLDLWKTYPYAPEYPLKTALTFIQAYRASEDLEMLEASVRFAEFICETIDSSDINKIGPRCLGQTASFLLRVFLLTSSERYLEYSGKIVDYAVENLLENSEKNDDNSTQSHSMGYLIQSTAEFYAVKENSVKELNEDICEYNL